MSLAVSFRGMETGVAAPVVGLLTDKYGPRKLVFAGSILAGLSFILLSRTNSLWSFYVFFILLSIGTSFCFTVPGYTAIANWFKKRRGTALGLSIAAIGGGGILIPVTNRLIEQYGWRDTLIFAGIGMWVIGIPASLVLRHHPEDYGHVPDGSKPKQTIVAAQHDQASATGQHSGVGVMQAMKTRDFWLLSAAATISSAGASTVSVHVMPFLISIEISRGTASSIAALVVISSIAGRLVFGWLGDRFPKKHLFGIALLLQAAGLLLIVRSHSTGQALAFALLFGPGFGGIATLRLAIQGEYFGRRAFGSIHGILSGIHTIGTIIGPLLAGWLYDVQGSYSLTWLILGVAILAVAPLLSIASRPPKNQAQ